MGMISVQASTEVGETPGRHIRLEVARTTSKQLHKHLGELDNILQQVLRQRLLVFPDDKHGADSLAPLGWCIPGGRIDVQRSSGVIVEMGVTRELKRGFGGQPAGE